MERGRPARTADRRSAHPAVRALRSVGAALCAGFARRAGGTPALLLAALLAAPAAAQDWRPLDPENTLVIDTTKGRMIVEMRPELAPRAVERIKLLAREGVYDGLQFHRVIEGFVAQTGNPNNKDGGKSRHPDLEPEFTFRLRQGQYTIVRRTSDGVEGYVGSTPFVGEKPDSHGNLRGWGAYCRHVVGMGRQSNPGTANSEIFFTLAPARRLDHDYTVVGAAVWSDFDTLSQLARGEPPTNPDRIVRVRILSDVPQAERPKVLLTNERGPFYKRLVDRRRHSMRADFSVCDAAPPAVTGVLP